MVAEIVVTIDVMDTQIYTSSTSLVQVSGCGGVELRETGQAIEAHKSCRAKSPHDTSSHTALISYSNPSYSFSNSFFLFFFLTISKYINHG